MSLTKRMIELQNEAVENALCATIPSSCEPCLFMSLDMMLDSEIIEYDDDEGRLLARYLLEVLA